jgi:hypothetical protein
MFIIESSMADFVLKLGTVVEISAKKRYMGDMD